MLLASLGVAMLLLGLLFLVGSAGQARRLAVAAVSLALGAVAAGLGVRTFRRAAALDPDRLEADILALARRGNGEVAETELAAILGDRFEAAQPVLDSLLAAGTCRRQVRAGTVYLLFPALQPRLQIRRCEYCGAELPVVDQVTRCPACGGAVKVEVVQRSLAAGEVYAMDDGDETSSR
jgi:hypothetical protein